MHDEDEVEVKEGDILAGKYRVEKVLGAGGMGVVVAARHTVLNNKVAIKFLRPSVVQHANTTARFLREAQAAVTIKSPHVAQAIDVGTLEDSGSPYMIMEFLQGRDVGQIIETEGSLEVNTAVNYALQACEALAAAHAAGIIHRDVKPANFFLTAGTDGTPMIKMLDFGISKNTLDAHDAGLTQTQMSMGSPLYMSPEQMRSSRNVDPRTDIWSLGVVMFEMLTGMLPFNAETMPQLCALVLEANAPRVTDVRPDVPDSLADVVAKCLMKNPDERFENVAELAAALSAFAEASGSADRCSRILAGAGMLSPVPNVEALSVELDPGAATSTAFGAHRPAVTQAEGPASSRSRLVFAGAAVAVAAAAVLFMFRTSGDAGAPVAAASTELATTTRAEPAAESEATLDEGAEATVPKPVDQAEPESDPAPDAGAEATPEPAESSQTAAKTATAHPAQAAAPSAPVKRRPIPRPKPKKKKKKQQPSTSVFDDRF